MATKAKSAKAEVPQVEQAVTASKETVEKVVKASTESYEQAYNMTKDQMEKASKSLIQGYDELTEMTQKNVEAFMKAGNIWAKGYEDLGKAYFSFAQEAAECSAEVAKAMMKAKTLQDVIDVHTDYAKKRFDHLVAEGTKMSEMSVKVATDAMQPLQQQFDSAVSTLVKPAGV